jgi:hypothetical protein
MSGKINSDSIPDIPSLHNNVITLMKCAIESKKYSIKTLQRKSMPNIHPITLLSEICDASGKTILDHAYKPQANGKIHMQALSQSKIIWPQQYLPPSRSWIDWQGILNEFTINTTTRTLKQHLGAWTPSFSQYREWKFRYHHHPTNRFVTTETLQLWHLASTTRQKQTYNLAFAPATDCQPDHIYVPVFPIAASPNIIIVLPRRNSFNF